MVADAEQAARAAHTAELERTKADLTELMARRDQLRTDADFLAAHLRAQRERVSGSIEALREMLARPTVLQPLPVPEKSRPDAPGVAAAADTEPKAATGATTASASPTAPTTEAPASADDEADVAGDLAALGDDAASG